MNKSTYCTLYLVRHGETDWNVQEIVQGHTDIALNIVGQEQAKLLANELKNIPFSAVYTSDLQRAYKTAEIIILEKKLSIEATNVLRERQFGHFEGKPRKTLQILDKLVEKLSDQERFSSKSFPDVESDEEMIARVITFLREVAIAHPSKNILVVTHGGILRILLIHLGFMTYAQSQKNIIGNTAYIQLVSDGVDFFVKETKGIMKK